MANEITFSKSYKAALQGGLVAAGVNIAWLYILEFSIGISELPKGFPVAVVISSIIPLLAGASLYVILCKNFLKGEMLFLLLSVGFTIFSLFPSFQTTLPDGHLAPQNFALLTVPMHFFAAVIGLYFLLKKQY